MSKAAAARFMTPAEVKAIRDAVGGTKAMADRLEVTDRAVRYLLKRGVRRPKLAKEIRGLVKAPKTLPEADISNNA